MSRRAGLWRASRRAPEILVLHGSSRPLQPFRFQPFTHFVMPSIMHARIGEQLDRARALQRLQPGDRAHQLHTVIGGLALAASSGSRSSPFHSTRTVPQPPGPGFLEQALVREQERSCLQRPWYLAALQGSRSAAERYSSGSWGWTSADGSRFSRPEAGSAGSAAAPRASVGKAGFGADSAHGAIAAEQRPAFVTLK